MTAADLPAKLGDDLRPNHVIKASAAIHISNKINLLERRAWNVLLWNCYDELKNEDRHSISINELCEHLAYNSGRKDYIKTILRKLASYTVEWNVLNKDETRVWGITGLLAEAEIINGICYYSFSKSLKDKLYNPSMYAKINLVTQNIFTSKYSLALYELFVDYFDNNRNIGETPWIKIDDFRILMGLAEDEYKEYKYLSLYVIRNPLNEINKKTNIFVTSEVKREKRTISHIKFHIKPNEILKSIPKLVKKAKQIPIPDPYAELDNLSLFRILVEEFQISKKKASDILKTYDELIIEQSLEYVRSKVKEGSVDKSLGGYTISVIENGGEQISRNGQKKREEQEIIKKQQEEDLRQKRREELREEFDQSLSENVWNTYQNLPIKIQNQLLTDFQEHADPVIRKEYDRKGLGSNAVQPMFKIFLKTALLTEEEMDFEKYYKENC